MKFSKGDVMSLDETLVPIILAGLIEFKQELIESRFGSYPSGMFDLVGVRGYNPTNEEDEACWNKWIETLDRMIYAFDPKEEPNTEDYEFEFVWQEEPTEDGNSLVSIDVDNRDEYDRYSEDKEIWERKSKEGRMLFAEYFHNLWI